MVRRLVRAVTGHSMNPVVSSWATRVVANGGAAPTTATKNALNTFYNGLVTDGIDTAIIALDAFVPDSLIACLTPLVVHAGNDPWTNIGSLTGASVSTSGLLINGSTQCLDSGVVASVSFSSNNDFGISAYTGNNSGLYSLQAGAYDNTNIAEIDIQQVGSGILAGAWNAWNINVAGLLTGAIFGFTSVSRITTLAAYQANSVIGFNTVTSGVAGGLTRPAVSIAVAGRNTSGVFSPTIRSAWYSFCAIHHGLTAAQTQKLFNRVQTLRTTLGGGFS
jgi:hypothetical protein